MSITTRFIGCLHFSHKNMAMYRGFQDEFYYDEHLIDSWNSIVAKKDITYILGDVTMEKKSPYYLLNRLNGVKHVVLGNHDRRQDVPELLKYVDSVGGMIEYKGFALTHCPIHPNEVVFYHGNIHAHIHHENKLEEVIVKSSYDDPDSVKTNSLHKYYNVDAKLVNYKPKTIEELLNR